MAMRNVYLAFIHSDWKLCFRPNGWAGEGGGKGTGEKPRGVVMAMSLAAETAGVVSIAMDTVTVVNIANEQT